MSNNRNLNGWTFLAGLAIGAGALYYANTPHGKEMRRKARMKGAEFSNTLQSKAQDLANRASALAEDVKSQISDTVQTGKDKFEQVKDVIRPEKNRVAEDFKAGVKRAKQNLTNGVEA